MQAQAADSAIEAQVARHEQHALEQRVRELELQLTTLQELQARCTQAEAAAAAATAEAEALRQAVESNSEAGHADIAALQAQLAGLQQEHQTAVASLQ